MTGDTKVVNRGKGDKVFINTTGIGVDLTGDLGGIGREREIRCCLAVPLLPTGLPLCWLEKKWNSNDRFFHCAAA